MRIGISKKLFRCFASRGCCISYLLFLFLSYAELLSFNFFLLFNLKKIILRLLDASDIFLFIFSEHVTDIVLVKLNGFLKKEKF